MTIAQSLGQVHVATTFQAKWWPTSRGLWSFAPPGTNIATNVALIQNFVKATTSFNLNYGDFEYLSSIDFEAANGSISSSTVRYGDYGLYLNNANHNTFTANNVYANASHTET